MKRFSKLTLLLALVSALTLVSAPVFAMEESGGGTGDSSTPNVEQHKTTTLSSEQKTEVEHNTTERKPRAAGSEDATKKGDTAKRLEGDKLKLCQRRQDKINGAMSRLASRGQHQVDLFSSIAAKVEAFYTSKGKTLANYDELVANVNTQKAAAQQAVDSIKSTSVSFKCDGSDPGGAASTFKTALKSEIQALKDYKTAVKNLIVGVKSVQGTDSSNGGTQ